MAGIVARRPPQKGDEIARRREAEPEHLRALGRIDELINVVLVLTSAFSFCINVRGVSSLFVFNC